MDDYDTAPTDPHHGGKLMPHQMPARIRELEEHLAEQVAWVQDLATELQGAEAKLAKLEAERDTVYREGFDDGCNHMKEDYKAGAKLAKAEAERDDYAFKLMEANNTYTEMHLKIEYAEAQFAATMDSLQDVSTDFNDAHREKVALEAMLPRAYLAGLEAKAQALKTHWFHSSMYHTLALNSTHALPIPTSADLLAMLKEKNDD